MADEALTRRLFKSGALVFVGFVLESGIAFVAKVIVARELGRVNFGALSLGIAILTVASTVSLLGLNQGIGRYVPRYDDPRRVRGVLRSAGEVSLSLAGVIAVILYMGADLLATELANDPTVAPVIRVFALAVPFAVGTKLALGVVQGRQLTLPKVIIQNLTMPIVRFGGVAVAFVLGLGVVGMSAAYALPHVVGATIGLYVVYRYAPLVGEYEPMHRSLVRFSVPLFASSIMGRVLTDIDSFILAAEFGTGPVGVYQVIYPLANFMMLFLLSFSHLFMPSMSELHADGQTDRLCRTYQVMTKWIVLLTLPLFLGFALFPQLAIRTFFGAEYLSGTVALRILASAFFVRILVGPNIQSLISIGESDVAFYTNVGAAVLNVVLNLALIPQYRIKGAAIATLVSYAALNIARSWWLYRCVGVLPLSGALLRPLFASLGLISVLYLGLFSVVPVTLPTAFLLLVVSALLYPSVIVALGGVEREEIMIIESIEDRFDVDLGPLKRLFGRLA
jgi:O-antigen/teichoic acid export membrane protein